MQMTTWLRDRAATKIITSSILALAILGWCLIGGILITAKSIGVALIFSFGVVYWASICRLLWPSQNSLNTYLPFGYSLCSLASFSLILLKQGTVASCLIASISGFILFGLGKSVFHTRMNGNSVSLIQSGTTSRSIAVLLLMALITTFLFADQLSSMANLREIDVNTTINGWSDIILHANTVLSLSSLAPGQYPISTLDYRDHIIPYHYASYILSALVSSLSTQASPLASYVCIVAPLGLLLLVLPLSEQLLTSTSRQAKISFITTVSILFLIYSLWVRMIGNSLMDPAWLLITAPATLYACAVVISGLQVGTGALNRRSLSLVGLALLVFLLTAFSKIQIAHALLPVVVIIVCAAAFRILRQRQVIRVNPWISIPLAGASLAGLHLYGNSLLNIGRKDPIREVMHFLSEITEKTWGHANGTLTSVAQIDWLAPLLGLMTLCGPIFLIAVICGMRRPARAGFREQVLILFSFSYLFSLLLSPSMPWDDGEFLNRSWPLLWCIGVWALLKRGSFKAEQPLQPQLLIIGSVIAVLAGWFILPGPKRESIASPPNREDWSKTFYPTTIRLSEKKLAKELINSSKGNYFFASSSASSNNFIFDDLPSRLAALSGIRPIMSRLSFQKSLPVSATRNHDNLTIESRYSQLLKRYAKACPTTDDDKSPIKVFRQPGESPALTVDVICKDLEQPIP
jgi:hypothetical protein